MVSYMNDIINYYVISCTSTNKLPLEQAYNFLIINPDMPCSNSIHHASTNMRAFVSCENEYYYLLMILW